VETPPAFDRVIPTLRLPIEDGSLIRGLCLKLKNQCSARAAPNLHIGWARGRQVRLSPVVFLAFLVDLLASARPSPALFSCPYPYIRLILRNLTSMFIKLSNFKGYKVQNPWLHI
jgi:hypothetical protein